MKFYKQETINHELPGIILLSHGPFAVSLVETAKMIFGEGENIAAYSLETGDDIDKYREAFTRTIEEFPENSVIFVDLFGGTPCNRVMRYIQETGKALEVVAGVNLPILIQAVMARAGKGGRELSLDTVENGKAQILRIDTEGFLSDSDDDE
ncbi:MAG: PTS sugar transporter subunit IIA [Clostridiales bacterium]|nr:PTS sugar transporter subunit IIA [Clostridiales bacterium]